MKDKIDKDRRKQIRNEIRKKALEEFKSSLPMNKENFKRLFDYLDNELKTLGCMDDHTITRRSLNIIGIENTEEILVWLIDHNGYCDCEILANVEEQFEQL
ncbi:DUF2695 domain-containing protein [Pedobacter sp. B4-66]|uniref:DUF2695 domain-containing protein n=1 Tax=Pedobacter sp. B4-66 TaxID=2817280 RepID=UPI001BDAE46D|nr:DUF2695 domain-containing protein [Pedobacter sp. B4-66]